MICPNAGPLGRTVEYPEYWWGEMTHGETTFIIPVWVAEALIEVRHDITAKVRHS